MFLGYNTNGFAHHRLWDAIEILAELGYEGVALTPDVNHFVTSGDAATMKEVLGGTAVCLSELGLRGVIDTGARFILDPRRKHQPTLISPTASERDRRQGFLRACCWY